MSELRLDGVRTGNQIRRNIKDDEDEWPRNESF
jgi:hypothetical protein